MIIFYSETHQVVEISSQNLTLCGFFISKSDILYFLFQYLSRCNLIIKKIDFEFASQFLA